MSQQLHELKHSKVVATTKTTKEIRTIAYVTTPKAKLLAQHASVRFSLDVCCVAPSHVGNDKTEYRIFAYCTPQTARRLQDYLQGFLDLE